MNTPLNDDEADRLLKANAQLYGVCPCSSCRFNMKIYKIKLKHGKITIEDKDELVIGQMDLYINYWHAYAFKLKNRVKSA